ncbi:hypothetical protein BDQ17DRAFT_1313761 [Cyathus striatus]|nr:hypothetical protein BDQ17DRAFT_1313761 [Cyathus striatus]
MKLIHIKNIQKAIQPIIDANMGRLATLTSENLDEEVARLIEDNTAFSVLSHRWSKDELTFQDMMKISAFTESAIQEFISGYPDSQHNSSEVIDIIAELSRRGNDKASTATLLDLLKLLRINVPSCTGLVKLINFCEVALQNDCYFAWLDTACIDRTRSAELEESIRSMFSWYRRSKICIVHLAGSYHQSNLDTDSWFTRGWTLQELLAPRAIKFYTADWQALTDKPNERLPDNELGVPLWERISHITGIPHSELLNFRPGLYDIRKRLGWASKRRTTRIEDMAYCLIGIFDLSFRIAYGEGKTAFHRLQVEIMEQCEDRALFLWTGEPSAYNTLLASGPECFSHSTEFMEPYEGSEQYTNILDPTIALTGRGLRVPLALNDFNVDIWNRFLKSDKYFFGENVNRMESLKWTVLGASPSTTLIILLGQHRRGSYMTYKVVQRFVHVGAATERCTAVPTVVFIV